MKGTGITVEVDRHENVDKLYVITKVEMNVVTFEKFTTVSNMSDNDKKKLVTLTKSIGTEKYEVTPEVNLEVVGRVGDVVKSIHGKLKNRKRKKLVINELSWL